MPFQFAKRKTIAVAVYILFKSLAYGCLGIVVGLIGRTFSIISLQSVLSMVAACCMLLILVVPVIHSKMKLPPWMNKSYTTIFHQLMKNPRSQWFALFGFINGWLPCGTVVAALAVAAVPASPIEGFLFMFIFGLATAPVLIIMIIFKKGITGGVKRIFSWVSKTAMLFVVVLLCWRAFGVNGNDPTAGKHMIFCAPWTKNK